MRLRFFLAVSILSAFLPATALLAGVANNNPTGPAGSFNGNVTTGCSYDPFTGNATRTVTDLVVPGAVGSYPLAFGRTSNSRGLSKRFGFPGAWRHSYDWTIDELESSTNHNFVPTYYTVSFPDGRIVRFSAKSFDSYFRGPPGVKERFQPLDSSLKAYLVLPDGGKIEFQATPISECDPELIPPCTYRYTYQAKAIIDPHGLRTVLAYNGDGTLSTIKEPAGRWIQINYRTTPWTNGSNQYDRVIDSISSSDRRSVKYNYAAKTFAPSTFVYTSLGNVVYYGDNSLVAIYTYQRPNVPTNGSYNGAPLLSTCDDPMYAGPMKKIAYAYATTNSDGTAVARGQILSEKISLTGPAVTSLGFIVSGRTETKGSGGTRHFTYDNIKGRVQSWSDYITPFSNRTVKGYDTTTGFVSSLTDRNGNVTNYTTDPKSGVVKEIKYPLTPPDTSRATVTYTYGSATCPDPNNRDANNPYYLYSVTDERGKVTTYTRDVKKRIARIDYPDGGVETFDYNPFGQVVNHRLRTGGLENYNYDPAGRLLLYRDAYHLTSPDPQNPSVPADTLHPSLTYNYHTVAPQVDRVRTITNARGKVTTFDQYNSRGQLMKVTHPLGQGETVASNIQMNYNTDGTLQWRQDELGHRISYGYDDFKRITSITLPPPVAGGPVPPATFFYYDHTGGESLTDYSHTDANPTRTKLPSGKLTKNVYNNNGEKTSTTVVGANGVDDAATTTYTYDPNGNLKTVKDPKGQASGLLTQYFYDARNRVVDMDDPMVNDATTPHRNNENHTTSWIYDQAGNKTSQKNANNQLITFTYDPANRLLQQDVAQTPSPVATTKYTYYTSGLLKTMQDPRLVVTSSNSAYTYTYDLMGRQTRLTYPPDSWTISRAEAATYDHAGNLATSTNRGGAVRSFTYDGRNRQISSTWSDGTTAPTFVYDPASRVTQISNADAVIKNVYFDDNTLKSQEEWPTAAGANYHRTVNYTYNVDGKRATIVYPSGKNFDYGYTPRNDLWFVRDTASQFHQAAYIYDLNGNVETRYVGFHWIITDASQRDPMNRIKHLEHRFASGSTAPATRSFDYTYNSMGSRTSIKRDGGATENYGYDLAQEVTTGIENGAATTYGYDANGNRTALNGGGSYVTNSLNQQTTFNGQTVGPDPKGNVASYGSTGYVYDAQNRLRNVTTGGVTSVFKYDGLNRKISQTIGGVTTYNVWDGWNLIEERNASNTLLHTYLYGAGEIIERITGTTKRFYFQDGLDSTSHFSEEVGTLLESYKYGTFGQQTVYAPNGTVRTTGTAYDIRHLYTGQLWMPQAGLYDYRNRAYSPTLTRFLQPDPIGFAGGDANLYRYCGGDPVNRKDPKGTQFFIPRDGEVERGSTYMMSEYGLVPPPTNSAYAAKAQHDVEKIGEMIELIVEVKVEIDEKLLDILVDHLLLERGIMLPKVLDPAETDGPIYPRDARNGGGENLFFSAAGLDIALQDWLASYSPPPNPGFEVRIPGNVISYEPLPNEPSTNGSSGSSTSAYGPYHSTTFPAAVWEASWGNGTAYGIAGGGPLKKF